MKSFAAHLNTKVATIDVVAKEQVACRRRRSTNFEQFHEVIKLAMNVTTD